ncbi:translocation protein SEC62-like isoform X2 [Oscarella lobularis]|uniref:translocation protein SEC62-like isoform X2 n=1 Tax=Oscarella lobularis TaxID=121494 RepID=UPI0033137288
MAQTPEQKAEWKAEESVVKWLRYNVKSKSTTIKGQKVDIFVGSKAVDKLLESTWATRRDSSTRHRPYLPTREAAVKFCGRMLAKGYFYRALKVEMKPKKDSAEDAQQDPAGGRKRKKGKKDEELKGKKVSDQEGDESSKTKKRKYKLEVCNDREQVFIDENEVYVWNYSPTRPWTYVIGIVVVLACLAASLFPLWPTQMRVGVWYLSTGLAGLLSVFFAVALLRYVVFGGVWLITHGTHNFWILPNLTEDCGFWESFKPAYKIDYQYDEDSEEEEDDDDDQEEEDEGTKQQ